MTSNHEGVISVRGDKSLGKIFFRSAALDPETLIWKITFRLEWGLVGWQDSTAVCPDLSHVVQFLRVPLWGVEELFLP